MKRWFHRRIIFLTFAIWLIGVQSKVMAEGTITGLVIGDIQPLLASKKYEQAYLRVKKLTASDPSFQKDGFLMLTMAALCDLAGHKKEADAYYKALPADGRHDSETGKTYTSDADAFLYWSTPFMLSANRGPELVSIAIALQTRALEALNKEEGSSSSLRRAKITHTLGLAYQFQGDFANSSKYLAQACSCFYALPEKTRDSIRENVDAIEQLAESRKACGRQQEAEDMYAWALGLSIDNNFGFVDLVGKYVAMLLDSQASQDKYSTLEKALSENLAGKKEYAERELNHLQLRCLDNELRSKGKPLQDKLDEVRSNVYSRLRATH